jgi:hypothetical protein
MGCGGAFFTTASPDSGAPDDAAPFDATNAVDGTGGSSASDAAADGSNPADAVSATDAPIPDADGAPATDAQAACPPNPVTFVMLVATSGGDRYCADPPDGCNGADWLTLRTATGAALAIDSACTTIDCSMCTPSVCPAICAVPSEVPDTGERRMWSGKAFVSAGCGPAAATACVNESCAPAGPYTARMCGYLEIASGPSTGPCTAATMTPTCVDVPFNWPQAAGTVVRGTIGSK